MARILNSANNHLASLVFMFRICPVSKRTIIEPYPPFITHHANGLERSILETLGQYADREKALEFIDEMARTQSNHKEDELREVGLGIKACEKDFELHLNLLKAGHISESQFAAANEPIKQQYDNLS